MAKLLVEANENLLGLCQALEKVSEGNHLRQVLIFETSDDATAKMLAGLGAELLGGPAKKQAPHTKGVMGVCSNCGNERVLAKDGECKVCKMGKANQQQKQAAQEGAAHTFVPVTKGQTKAEEKLQENINRVVQEAQARENAPGGIDLAGSQRSRTGTVRAGRKLG